MVAKKKSKKKAKPLLAKETLHILVGLGVLVLLFFAFSWVFKDLGKIDYKGLTFIEERFGQIPVWRYTYFYESQAGEVVQYNLFLRTDPAELNVPVEGGEIEFPRGKHIYVSVDSVGLTGCSDSAIAISSMVSFLVNNEFTVLGATPYAAEAELRELRHADCSTHPNNPVVLFRGGNQTRVVQEGPLCWVIESAECEVLKAGEQFIVQSILDAKAREYNGGTK
tara:strand:- start:70 stop:738 length:669 start_codon:yes stop_codon:yes gene_type:complete